MENNDIYYGIFKQLIIIKKKIGIQYIKFLFSTSIAL